MRQHAILPAPHVKQARLQLLERGIVPQTAIDARIAASWQRSYQAGLPAFGLGDCADNLDAYELKQSLQRNRDLIQHSQPIIDFLFEQVKHSQSMVILADAQGVLMHTVGDLDFLSKAERVALRCGASWAEQQRGTNAIGTALAECNEIEIHGAEHYLEPNEFLTCAAAPIVSAQGSLMGILDISGDHRGRQSQTLGLVSTAVQMIENSMVLGADAYPILVQFHAQAAGISSVAQGILAVSEDGYLLGANRRALAILGLRFNEMHRAHWSHFFDTKLEDFLSQQLRRFAGLSSLKKRRLGRQSEAHDFYAQLHPHSQVFRATPSPSIVVRSDGGRHNTNIDPQWQDALSKACRVIERDIPLLLSGESGVGKEVFAKQIHAQSSRSAQAFIAVNCAAIPEHLIEAELFGYVGGAFTGASKQGAIGRIREADGGTLFLDEIGDMPLTLQTRLLRVLQERSVVPVGSGVAQAVDFRLICASHQNLREKVKQAAFREDLFYRINGLQLQLPALRQRRDFVELCQRILSEFCTDPGTALAPEVMRAMQAYTWPGNVRQLRHCLRTATALLDDGEAVIQWKHFAHDMLEELGIVPGPQQECIAQVEESCVKVVDADLKPHRVENLRVLSQQAIEHALRLTNGNVSEAARQLGVSRQTMYLRLREH